MASDSDFVAATSVPEDGLRPDRAVDEPANKPEGWDAWATSDFFSPRPMVAAGLPNRAPVPLAWEPNRLGAAAVGVWPNLGALFAASSDEGFAPKLKSFGAAVVESAGLEEAGCAVPNLMGVPAVHV